LFLISIGKLPNEAYVIPLHFTSFYIIESSNWYQRSLE